MCTQMLRRIIPLLGIVCVVLTLAVYGCAPPPPAGGTGVGGDTGDGEGSGQTGPLAPMVAVADEASDEFERMYDEAGWAERREEFMAYAQSLEGVAQVNVHEASGDVTLVYDSGIFHIFHVPDNNEDEAAEPEQSRAVVRTTSTDPGHDVLPRSIPGAPRATMASSYDPGNRHYGHVSHALGVVRLALDHAGYEVPGTIPTADVEWFRSWGDYGVIFFQGHGNVCTFTTISGEDIELFALQTSNRYFDAAKPDSRYTDDLVANRLGLVTLQTSGGRVLRVLAVTRLFFEHHLSAMQPGAVVYMNSCRALFNTGDLPQTLTGLGAEMILGWSTRSPMMHSADMAELFFDRACGLNQISPADPPRRPFTVDDVYQYFVDNGLTTPTWTSLGTGEPRLGSFETYPDHSADPVTSLRPVISEAWFVPALDQSLAHLRGYFGDDQGQILVGDTEIDVLTWSEDRVIGLPPRDLVGDIVVRANELDSNPVRLTRYSGSVHLDVQDPEGRWAGTADVNFSGRGIVHRLRDEIDGEPRGQAVPPVTVTRMWLDEEYDMTWDISGDWETGCDDPPGAVYYNLTATGYSDESFLAFDEAGFGIIVDLNLDAAAAPGAGPGSPAVTYDIKYFVNVDGTRSWWGCSSGESQWDDNFDAWHVGDPTPTGPAGADAVIPSGSHAGAGYQITWDDITPDLRPPWGSGDEVRPAGIR